MSRPRAPETPTDTPAKSERARSAALRRKPGRDPTGRSSSPERSARAESPARWPAHRSPSLIERHRAPPSTTKHRQNGTDRQASPITSRESPSDQRESKATPPPITLAPILIARTRGEHSPPRAKTEPARTATSGKTVGACQWSRRFAPCHWHFYRTLAALVAQK